MGGKTIILCFNPSLLQTRWPPRKINRLPTGAPLLACTLLLCFRAQETAAQVLYRTSSPTLRIRLQKQPQSFNDITIRVGDAVEVKDLLAKHEDEHGPLWKYSAAATKGGADDEVGPVDGPGLNVSSWQCTWGSWWVVSIFVVGTCRVAGGARVGSVSAFEVCRQMGDRPTASNSVAALHVSQSW